MLDISRITTGKMRLDRQPADLAVIVEAAVETVRPAAEAKRMSIDVALDRSIGLVLVDTSRIQQIVWNLVSNAIKFSPANATIQVMLRREDAMAVIEVGDDGPGIRGDLLPHIFERFRQGDTSVTRAYTGLGLGLALAKELVELHGGRIEAESEEGDGARFVVRLPIPDSEPPEDEHESSAPPRKNPLRGVRVLYVDDREDARRLIAMMLSKSGAEVLEAASVDEALAALEQARPDVVVTDIAMPYRDGYELLESMRAHEAWAEVPVVALTAQGHADDEHEALAAGFREYLRKPVESGDLTAKVARAAFSRRRNDAPADVQP